MQRFHVHVAVDNLTASIDFYSKLFGTSPCKRRAGYAKWMLEDPRVTFAVSACGHGTGVSHLGFQAETPEELAALKARAEAASAGAVLDQGLTACCYAKSEKHWTVDPQGLAWEHFLTMSDTLTFNEGVATRDGACCLPVKGVASDSETDRASCISSEVAGKSEGCCA
jgi:catechol 2,3-dioxygenase-like lactoylglutathione lyase family enzyme